MTIQDLFSKYLDYSKRYKKTSTHSYYLKEIRCLSRLLSGLNISTVKELDAETIDRSIDWYRENTKKKNSTINDTLDFFYSVFRHFKIESNLPIFKKLPNDTKETRAIHKKDLNAIVHFTFALPNDGNGLLQKLIIALLLDTGVRANELLNIKISNIDITEQTIYLEETKSGKPRLVHFGKSTKQVISLVILENQSRGTDNLLWNYLSNSKCTYKVIVSYLERLKRNLHIPTLHMHQFRKTFAIGLQHANCPLDVIQHLLGHSDIKMTMRYLNTNKPYVSRNYKLYQPDYSI